MRDEVYFSIIIPTYNRAGLIAEAIACIQGQTFSKWELLVVDDGSTDNTAEVVGRFKSDERIRYIYQQNAERSAARNKGVSQALGKYICFLDSDDVYLPNHLSVFYDFLTSNGEPVAMVRTFAEVVREGQVSRQLFNRPESAEHPLHYVLTNIIYPSNVCVHRSILEKHRFDESISYAEDTDLWTRILAEYPLLVAEEISTRYVIHAENSSGVNSSLVHEKYICTFQKIFKNKKIAAEVPSGVRRIYFSKRYKWLVHSRLQEGSKRKAFAALLQACRWDPLFVVKKEFYALWFSLIFR